MTALDPSAERRLRRVFVHGLALDVRLGIHPHEKAAPQRVVIDLELLVDDPAAPASIGPDRFERVVDYAALADTARTIATNGHTLLVETLAERIALAALADPRVARARVTVAKPDAIADAVAVGATVERVRDA